MKRGLEIQGGDRKGHKIRTPKGIRPTRALLKRSLFDRLGGWVVNVDMLELYAGSGAVGLEALSRGAKSVAFVEASRQVALILKENVKKLGYSDRARVIHSRAMKALREFVSQHESFDFIFADPPYRFKQLDSLMQLIPDVLAEGGIFVLETHKKTPAPSVQGLKLWKEARIGDTILRFYIRDLSGDL